jgi:hypothetical protein
MSEKHMHPQQSGADFRQFIPRFRRFGGLPMTLAVGLPTLSSLAAYLRRGEMKNGCNPENPRIFSRRPGCSV